MFLSRPQIIREIHVLEASVAVRDECRRFGRGRKKGQFS
jgi:hypothetical protein